MAKRIKTEGTVADNSLAEPQIPDSSTDSNDSDPATNFDPENAPSTPASSEEGTAGSPHATAVKQQEQKQFPDPNSRSLLKWPDDAYQVTLQESRSRNTIEIQFGDGSKAAQPQAFAAIKDRLKAEGFRWNGQGAWAKELAPEYGTMNQKVKAREENRRIRGHIEDVVFPAIIALEEQVRGEIPLTEEFRQRITKAASVGRG